MAAVACSMFLSSCALFDSGIPWRSGPYKLLWIDLPDEVQLVYDIGRGGSVPLVAPRVFAVGSDDRYVVAKQHPHGDKAVTNYFIVDRRSVKSERDIEGSAVGPLDEAAFRQQASTLKLPAFTKTLETLQ